jgi:hypothetical protein
MGRIDAKNPKQRAPMWHTRCQFTDLFGIDFTSARYGETRRKHWGFARLWPGKSWLSITDSLVSLLDLQPLLQ